MASRSKLQEVGKAADLPDFGVSGERTVAAALKMTTEVATGVSGGDCHGEGAVTMLRDVLV